VFLNSVWFLHDFAVIRFDAEALQAPAAPQRVGKKN